MEMKPLEVIQDMPTRWNNERTIMFRLLELCTATSVELSQSGSVKNLSCAEWKLMAGLVSVIQPIQQVKTEPAATKYPTLSQVIPLLEITLKEYTSEANDVASFAISQLPSLKTRYMDANMSLVDPHYKAVFHFTPNQKLGG